MRFNLFCSLARVAVVVISVTLPVSAQSAGSVTVPMRPFSDARTIIAVKIDGAGPYDFLVDTGATATVVDAALFQELGLGAKEAVTVASGPSDITRAAVQVRARAKEVSVEGLAVKDLVVQSLPNLPFGRQQRTIRGILGENFLEHFDILIDNQHRKVTLDAGPGLAATMAGERMPIVFEPGKPGESMRYRPMVTVSVATYGSRPVKALLDSGADKLVLAETSDIHPRTMGNGMMISGVNGSMVCTTGDDKLHWGKATVSGIQSVTCQNSAAKTFDHEGNLPTILFKQLFICHSGLYAIVNPATMKPATEPRGPQEVAAGTTPVK